MNNKDDRNKLSNEMEQSYNNTEKLKVDEQIKLQKKKSEQAKRQDSSSSSTNHEHNKEARKLRGKSATRKKQKEVSMKISTEHVQRQDSPCSSTNHDHNKEPLKLRKKSTTRKNQEEVPMKISSENVKGQDSPCSSINHENNEEARNLRSRSVTRKKQKEVSMKISSENVKGQDSPCSNTNHEHNEESRNLRSRSVTRKKQKEVSMKISTEHVQGQDSPCSNTNDEHNEEAQNLRSRSATRKSKKQKEVSMKIPSDNAKGQVSPCSSANYEYNEETPKLPRKSAIHKTQKEISMKKCTEHVKAQDSPSSSTNNDHKEAARNLRSRSATRKKQKEVTMKKCTEQVTAQDSPCSTTSYEHKEEAPNLRSRSAKRKSKEQKEVSMKISSENVKGQDFPCNSTNYAHKEEARNLRSRSATRKKQKEVSMFATKKNPLDSPSQLRFDTYKKRSGTTDLGKDYEKLMCALLALKFSISPIVADFEMKTNSDDCGDFDDVALKVTFVDGQSQTFLLQLKHSKNMKHVTDKKLAAKNDNFSLLKNLKSIRKFENAENVSFILYTNSPTRIKNNSQISLKNDNEVVVRELQDLDPKKLLLTSRKIISSKKEATKVFQFKLNQSSESVKGLDDHLKRFYFFAHQTNTTGAQSLINDMLREECGINDASCSSSFIQFMETWWSGNFILTKYDVVTKLAELTLTPFIQTISNRKCNDKSKLLKEAIMKFDMTIVRDTNEEIIANIWNETATEDEISLTSLKYGLRPKGSNNLSTKERSKVLWHLNKVPLIVKAEECHQVQVKHAIRLLEKVEKKKLVLLVNATKEEFPGWKIFQDLSDLPNEGVYTDIVKHFEVSLQGRQSILLEQLLNFDKKNGRIIETTELIKMTEEVIQIGRRREKAFETYIPRIVSTMSVDIIKMSEFCKTEKSLLIICNVSQPWNKAIRQMDLQVLELDQYLKLEDKNKLNEVDVLLTSNKWSQVQFNDICKETERNVHLLQVFDDKSCTSVLSKENRFSLETIKSKGAHVDESKIFTFLDHPLNVICSPPGMGKSTLVSRMSRICPSSYWSVRVNLINHKTVFRKEHEHDEILHHFVEEEEDALVVKIRSMLLQNKRIYFFLDGLDEIDSNCLQIALNFIKHISSLGHRVWITSRKNLEQTVSQELKIFPIKIKELSEEQQKAYIQKRLQNIYHEDEVEHITDKIYANVDIVNSRHLLGVPLQLFMVTENFRDNKILLKKPDQEIFVLTKMYKIFFQGKKKHQHRKLGVHEHEDQIGYDFDVHLEQYELPALESCLDARTLDKLKINFGKSQKFLEKLRSGDPFGIVSRVTDDNQAIFDHQTFAEYFACVWLKNNLDKVSLLEYDLFNEENQNLKFIFDIMLAENSALHLAVIYRHTDLVLEYLDKNEVKDEGGRNPLQLLCSYGVEHLLSWKKVDVSFSICKKELIFNKYYSENNIEVVSTQYKKIFKMLSNCDIFQKDDLFRWDCLDYAIRLRNLFAVEKFLERFEDSMNLEILLQHYDSETLVYYSSQMGYANLLRAAIRKDSEALSVNIGKCNLTLLHLAIIRIKNNNKFEQSLVEENIKVITTLIECGLDVDGQCDCKRTALHWASELDDDVIVKVLLDLGANINLTDHVGRNALHFALENSKVNMRIVKLLLDEGIDAEAKDDNGKTPLHLCCIQGHYDALVMLLDHGLDVKVATEEKINLLHTIFRQHKPNKEMMSLLISKGADVNGKDHDGRTALHYACKYGGHVNATDNYQKNILHHTILSDTSYAKIIFFLLENGACVNAKDSENRSVLHYAVFQRNFNCIKVLLDQDADINAVCDFGKTVLHAAFEKPHTPDVEVIQLLLNKGVDSNKRDKNQKTALDYAVTSIGSHRVVNMLFDARAHDQLISADYVTFLHYAVYAGNCFAVELFLESGLDLDNLDVNNHEYPLNFAVENQHLRSDLLLKMTKFIRDCQKKANFVRKRIVELLEEYFSNGYGSDSVPVRDRDHIDSIFELRQPASNLWSSDLNDFFNSLCDDSEDEWKYSPEDSSNSGHMNNDFISKVSKIRIIPFTKTAQEGYHKIC